MQEYNYLLDKLQIRDFLLKSTTHGSPCLGQVRSYFATLYKQQGGGNNEVSSIKQSMIDNGIDKNMVDEVFKNPEILKIIMSSQELTPEIKEQIARVENLRKTLNIDQSLPKDKRDELEKDLKDMEENLELIKKAFLEQKNNEMMSNPAMVEIITKMATNEQKQEIVKDEFSEELEKLRNSIYENFLLDKQIPREEVNEILNGNHPKSLNRKEVNDLLFAIYKQEGNMLGGDNLDFFMNTASLRK